MGHRGRATEVFPLASRAPVAAEAAPDGAEPLAAAGPVPETPGVALVRLAPVPRRDLPLDLPPLLAVPDRPPLVPHVLAARQRDLDLRVRALEVDPGRDERQALLV